MRIAAAVMVVVAACAADDGSGYPMRPPGGGGGGGGGGGDARGPDAPPTTLAGRICVVTDLRHWSTGCADTGVAGLIVTIGSEVANTNDDGTFTIAVPTGTVSLAKVEGTGIVTSFHPYVAGSVDAVAPTTQAWDDLLAASSIAITDGNGALMGELQVNDGTRIGVIGESDPAPGAGAGAVYYDNGLDKDIWEVDQTDINGKALFADLPAGNTVITERYSTFQKTATVQVQADAILFFTMNLMAP